MDFQLDRLTGLTRGGEPISLEPQALQLLEFLIVHRNRIVSKQDIIDEIWDGNAITDAALNTRVHSVRKALGDTAAASQFIKTFPKRGFQFIAEVEIGLAGDKQSSQLSKRRVSVSGMILLLMFVFGSYSLFISQKSGLQTEKPSLAVVQFDNLNNDQSAQYFVDGLTEDLNMQLSRNRELFVVSSATMFSYAKESATPLEIARDLGVSYVVRGSVQRNNDQVRVTSELIDVSANESIWAQAFERQLTDTFEMQGEISQTIVGQLLPEIYQSDAERLTEKPTQDMGAWDLYLRGRARQAVFSKDAQEDAMRFARKAIDLDPNSAGAHSLLARALGTAFFFRWTDTPQETLVDATEAARRAIELDDKDAQAHAALGYIYRYTGEAETAIANLERAVVLNPNEARIRLELAHTYDWFRLQEQALPQIEMALKLSPRDPMLQNMYFYKGHILFHLERYEEALEAARQLGAVATSTTWRVFHHLLRAAALVKLTRKDEALKAINNALLLNRKLSVSAMRRQFAGSKNHPENRRIWLSSLKTAGLPE